MIMIVDYMYVCFTKSMVRVTHKGIKERIELRGFLGQYCFCTKPEDLVEPESLEGELYGTEDVTQWVQALQGRPDVPAVVLCSIDQHCNGVV